MEPRPVINLDEPIGKIVGKRRPPPHNAGLQDTINQVFEGQRHRLWPRGVYRFNSHEEANAWRMKMLRPNKTN
ncbi:MAG: hypothetical protein KDK99_17935 [Verrucomicrobiales bacterium]|nr:hypothetical protein [Verrucomicrobiales bacterium]